MFDFHPYLGRWSNFTNMFQMGRNHKLEESDPVTICCADILFSESEWCWGMFIAIGSCWSSAAANMSKLGWVFMYVILMVSERDVFWLTFSPGHTDPLDLINQDSKNVSDKTRNWYDGNLVGLLFLPPLVSRIYVSLPLHHWNYQVKPTAHLLGGAPEILHSPFLKMIQGLWFFFSGITGHTPWTQLLWADYSDLTRPHPKM